MKATALSLTCFLFIALGCKKEDVDEPKTPIAPEPEAIYFPQNFTGVWEWQDWSKTGWDSSAVDDLYAYLDDTETRGFVVLRYGRLALEHYNGKDLSGQDFGRTSNWYWASAGKSLTAFAVGIASKQGFVNIENATSSYIGTGWTSCTPAQEGAITVRDQLQMTTGLDDGGDVDCIDDTCLTYLADAGTRWAYHNAPYTLLHDVISFATPVTFEEYINNELLSEIGIGGNWFWLDGNHVFFSSARSMARFGILNLANGSWNGDTLIDRAFFENMTHSSQTLNESYGYLYWLNGNSTFMLPGSQITFPGPLCANAPADMYAAIGKNGQFMCVVPSLGLVVVRMGGSPSSEYVPVVYLNEIWSRLNQVLNR